jgi:hypothetical protein
MGSDRCAEATRRSVHGCSFSGSLSAWRGLERPWEGREEIFMIYCILCYESEALAAARSQQEDEAMIARLRQIQTQLKAEGKLGPVARLLPTTTATHVRSGKKPVVMDGPFAETKEQLLGIYFVDCATLEEAIETAKQLAHEKPHGVLEIRPVAAFNPVAPSSSFGDVPT